MAIIGLIIKDSNMTDRKCNDAFAWATPEDWSHAQACLDALTYKVSLPPTFAKIVFNNTTKFLTIINKQIC
jgi:hypothetical protein